MALDLNATGKGATTVSGRRDNHSVGSLLAIAVEVFNVRGYDGTSMEDLARAAGITKSSIYHHVSGKEELLRLAVSRALDGLFASLEEPGATQGTATDRLEYVIRRTCLELVGNLPYVTLLLRVRGNTAAEREALERRRDFDHRMAALVEAAVAEGGLRPGLDPRLTARLVFGMVNSVTEWFRPQASGSTGSNGTGSNGTAEQAGAGAGMTGPAIAEAVTALVFDGLRADGH
ncbi:MAG TPA: TetR/AcrR family transcriptional regulator [Actinocrinis sp.]